MSNPNELATLISTSLRTLLSETMFHAADRDAYILNPGEPGFVETLKSLSAPTVSTPPGPGRKPIVSHANHVLFGLELMCRAIHGDANAFADADWETAWRLESVTDDQWAERLRRLEQTATEVLEDAPRFSDWNEIMLTGVLASAAHTAYHVAAIRQILRSLEQSATQ